MMHKPLVGALLGALGLVAISAAQAATPTTIHAGAMGKLAPAALASRLGLDSQSSLSAQAQGRTVRGTLKTREQQMFGHVPVYGHALPLLPPLHRGYIPLHVRGDFLPRLETIVARARGL